MRVLILSLDRALVDKSGEGDTFKRFVAYKRACEHLSVIVPIRSRHSVYKKAGITIYPAFGTNNILAYWRVFWLSRQLIKNQKIELVVTNDAVLGAMAVWWRNFYAIKVQVNIFGLEIVDANWLRERPQNIFLKLVQEWAIRRADSLRTDSQGAKHNLSERYSLDIHKIVVIPVAPSKESQKRFLSAQPSQIWGKRLLGGGHKKLVISVGSLVKAKDFLTLVKAALLVCKRQPQTVFAVGGEGPERDRIQSEIEIGQLQNNFKLLGSIAYDKLPALFASADIFVLSSAHEGFPRVLMEAALSARPIVATAIDGASDLINPWKTGVIVPIQSPKRLAKAIGFLLTHPQLAKKFGREAQRQARQLFDFERICQQVTTSWRRLVL